MDELRHYGINGQKWGVRRWQNADGSFNEEGKKRYGRIGGKRLSRAQRKAISQDIRSKTNELVKNDSRQKQIEEYYKQMTSLYNKYDFDGDDGGGGSTKASQAAGKKYMELSEKIAMLEDKIRSDALRKAKTYVDEQYGNGSVAAYDAHKKFVTGAVFVGIELAICGTLGFMMYSDLKK